MWIPPAMVKYCKHITFRTFWQLHKIELKISVAQKRRRKAGNVDMRKMLCNTITIITWLLHFMHRTRPRKCFAILESSFWIKTVECSTEASATWKCTLNCTKMQRQLKRICSHSSNASERDVHVIIIMMLPFSNVSGMSGNVIHILFIHVRQVLCFYARGGYF